MTAYIVCEITVTDPERYERYRKLAGPAVEAAGGRFLVRGGAITSIEGGAPPERSVILEFADRPSAEAFWDSDAYRVARSARDGAATFRAYIVDGAAGSIS